MRDHWLDSWERERGDWDTPEPQPARSIGTDPDPLARFSTLELVAEIHRRLSGDAPAP